MSPVCSVAPISPCTVYPLRRLVQDAAALDDEELAGHEVAVAARQEERRARDVVRHLDALEGPLVRAARAAGAHLVGQVLLAHGRTGRQAVHVHVPGTKLLRQYA